MPRNTPHKYGYDFRTKDRRVQKRDQIDLTDSLGGTVDQCFTAIRNAIATSGLVDVSIDTDVDYGSYGDRDRDRIVATGWRDLTPEEKAEAEARIAARQSADAARNQAALDEAERALRAARPDLFAN